MERKSLRPLLDKYNNEIFLTENKMTRIRLEKVTRENFHYVIDVSVYDFQKKYLNFEENPVYFIAKSKFHPNLIPMAIIDGCYMGRWNEVVGFMVYGLDTEEKDEYYTIEGFMINKRDQKKGYGKKAMELILNEIKKDKSHNKVRLTVHEKNIAAINLYKSFGFKKKEVSFFIVDETKHIAHYFYSMELTY